MKYIIIILTFLLLGCNSDGYTPSEYFIVRHIEIRNEQIVLYTAKNPNKKFRNTSSYISMIKWGNTILETL